jgi:two-component system phosphate regulon response regulator PhoB
MGNLTDGLKGVEGSVLVIEDDASLAQLIVYMLTREGFEPLIFTDGDEGLVAIRRYRPKIVILDLTLPGLSGDEVCRAVRSDPELRDTFVLVTTALDDHEARQRVRDAGANCYMCKPFDPVRLVELIENVLEDKPGAAAAAASA